MMTAESVDNFFKYSLLIGCFAIRDQFYWQKQTTHNNIYWNISDTVAKSIIASMAIAAVIGFLILSFRIGIFFLKANRTKRMKEKMREWARDQERDSLLNTAIFFLMGGIMAVLPIQYIGLSAAAAVGFGVALDSVFKFHEKQQRSKVDRINAR